MDGKDPDGTEEENLWLPAQTDTQQEKKYKAMGAALIAATECTVEVHA